MRVARRSGATHRAGSKATALVENGSAAVIGRLYDHHSVIESYRGARLRVGDRVAVVPNNANSMMALLRSVWITEDKERAVELRPQPDG